MRQPVDLSKIQALMAYHAQLKEAFKNGTLKGKMKKMLLDKMVEINADFTLRAYYRRLKCH